MIFDKYFIHSANTFKIHVGSTFQLLKIPSLFEILIKFRKYHLFILYLLKYYYFLENEDY